MGRIVSAILLTGTPSFHPFRERERERETERERDREREREREKTKEVLRK